MIDPEAEAQVVAAKVGDDVALDERAVDGAGGFAAEAQEMAAVRLRDRYHQLAGVQRREPERAEALDETLLQAEHVGVDIGDAQAQALQPVEHRVQAIEPDRIEGRAQEAPGVLRVGDAPVLALLEGAEGGVPAGVPRPCPVAGRRVHEGHALAGHGVLVAAGEIEGAGLQGAEVCGQRQEAVVAVDHDQGLGLGHRGNECRRVGHGVARIVKHLAEVDEIVPAARGGLGKAIREIRDRLHRDARELGQARLLEPARLAREAVELAIGAEQPRRPPGRQARQQTVQEPVAVGREDDVLGPAQAEDARDAPLGGGGDLAQDRLPLAIGQARRVQPTARLGLEGHVRPQVVAVRGEVQPPRVRLQEAPEVRLVTQASLSASFWA